MDIPLNRNGLTHSDAGKIGYEKSKASLERLFKTREEAYNLSPKQCKGCLIKFKYSERRKTFCSRSCSAKFNNEDRVKTKKCIGCGKEIVGYSGSDFCNRDCWKIQRKKEIEEKYQSYIAKWKSGEEKGWQGKGYAVHKYIRRFFFEKFNSKCQECGWSKINPSTNKVPLQIDHKDGDASNCKEENLRLLCPNCHSLTPTFGRLNKITVRKHR